MPKKTTQLIRIEIGHESGKDKYSITDIQYAGKVKEARRYAVNTLMPRSNQSAYFFRGNDNIIGYVWWDVQRDCFIYSDHNIRNYPNYPDYLVNPDGSLGERVA